MLECGRVKTIQGGICKGAGYGSITGAVKPGDFEIRENGGVLLSDFGRKKVLTAWQKKKSDQILHPFLQEKISWGLVPYVQALLLARSLRGDLDDYPPFMWK